MHILPLVLLLLSPVTLAGNSSDQSQESPHNTSAVVFKSGPKQARLIELFTSQGCSSCPPAERWLNQWTSDQELWETVVPVAFHVDYWDRLGWADPFASNKYSVRQRDYQRSGNVYSVYTPGFVVNGEEWRGYYKGRELVMPEIALGDIEVVLDNRRLSVHFTTDKSSWLLPIELNVAILGMNIVTEVTSGENAHKDLPQEFISLFHDATLSTSGRWMLNLPDYEREGVQRYAIAVWATHPVSKKVVQATGGWLGSNGRPPIKR